jgi:hypothetical protein
LEDDPGVFRHGSTVCRGLSPHDGAAHSGKKRPRHQILENMIFAPFVLHATQGNEPAREGTDKGEHMKNAKGGATAEIQTAAPVMTIPESSELFIDARALESFLVDVADGGTQGMRREHEGIAEVVHEIGTNQKTWGSKAGVTVEEVATVVTTTAQLAQLRAFRPTVAKLLEMIDETEALLEDKQRAAKSPENPGTCVRAPRATSGAPVVNVPGA